MAADRSGRLLTAVVAASVAVAFADSSIVVLALPALYTDFHTSLTGVSFVITSYNVVVFVGAFALVPFTRRLHVREVTRVGLALFTAGSIGCAAAWALTPLIVFRCVQGAGGALLLAGSLPLLGALAGGPQRGARIWTAAGTFGAAVGPALGGVLTQLADWRAIFVFQAPIAAVALVATFDRRVHELPVEERAPKRRGATVANAGLALVFAGLVGALFLSVLLVITVWERRPIAGALIVSALPAGAFLVRPLAARLPRREAATGGALLLAAGLVALALLPAIDDVLLAISLGFCGVGLGLAVPVLTVDSIDPEHAPLRSGTITVGARHLGLVASVALIAPLLTHALDSVQTRATLAGTRVIMDGNIDLTKKVPIALDMRDAFQRAQNGEIPDLAKPFDDRGAKTDSSLRALRDTLLDTLRGAVSRAFRSSFLLSAIFALLALIPARMLREKDPGYVRRLTGSRIALLVLGVAAVALIAVELGMGAIGFGEAHLANPCTTEPQVSEGGFFGSIDAAVQRFALSGLNGAACSLHTSREELVLSFAPSLGTKKVRWDKATIRKALRAGFDRAAHDAAGGGLVGDAVAFILREGIADPLAYFLGQKYGQ